MRGVYSATIAISGVTAAKSLMILTGPSTKCFELLSASVTSKGSNVLNQNLRCVLQRITTLGTPTGTSLTPSKHEPSDQASAVTCLGNITANEPTFTSDTELGHSGAPSIAGWHWDCVPEEKPVVAPSASIGVRLLDAITSADLVCTVVYREIG